MTGWTRLRERCITGCSSGSAEVDCDINPTGISWELSLAMNLDPKNCFVPLKEVCHEIFDFRFFS
jgi:hypothetical protein